LKNPAPFRPVAPALASACGDFPVQDELPIAQPSHQVFSNMRDSFQLVETQRSAHTLDCVDGAKHTGERALDSRVLLPADQIPVNTVQTLELSTRKSWSISLSLIGFPF
jgi:hypothetical protein